MGFANIERNVRVNVAAAGAHNQAGQRGKSHGCIQADAVIDGRNRCAVAEVAGYDFSSFANQFGSFLRYIGVRGAVKSVAADFMFGVLFHRQGIKECLFGHSLVECRIENNSLRYVRQKFLNGFNA